MSGATLTRTDAGLRLTGGLRLETVRSLADQAEALLPAEGTVTLDLDTVAGTDSAGVALLLDWLRMQRRHGGDLVFVNMPEQLRAIARVSGVDGLLAGAPDTQ
ncbi:MAG: STAS domain-containing protein [Ectothiorhodospiraceae bacterium]